ncbi:MAG TPA: isochorismatase family protein [Planctomycetota bacterium]
MGHPRLLRREDAALVLVDLQDRLHREVVRKDAVAAAATKLAAAAKILGVPVVLAEHAAKAFGSTIEPVRNALASYAPVHKMVFSCFGSEEFRSKLAALGRKQILAAGFETHICLCQTALDALDAGYQVHVARDASSARSEESHAAGLEKMAGAGVIPATAESAIYELLGRAGTDEFRAILPLIKGS